MKIIEFVGLPGSGKSTLLTILMKKWRSPSVLVLEECILLFSGVAGRILMRTHPRFLDICIRLIRFIKICQLPIVCYYIHFRHSQIVKKNLIVNEQDLEFLQVNLKSLSEASTPVHLKYDIANYVRNLMSTYLWIAHLSISRIVVLDEGLTSNIRGMGNLSKASIDSFIKRWDIWFIYCFSTTEQAMTRLTKRKMQIDILEMNNAHLLVPSRPESHVDFLRREKSLIKLLSILKTNQRLLLHIDNSNNRDALDNKVSLESYIHVTKRLFDNPGREI